MCSSKGRRSEETDRLGKFLRELEDCSQGKILPSDVVNFSAPLRAVFNQATRMGQITLQDVSEKLELPPDQAKQVVNCIVEKGFLRQPSPLDDEPVYQTRLAVRTRPRAGNLSKDIFSKLDDL